MLKSDSRSYLLYALLALPLALLGLPLYIYLPTYYAQEIGLGVFGVGATLLVARVLDMLLDPIIGYWSDRYYSRKCFIVIGALFLLFGFYYLTHPIVGASYSWLFIFSLLTYFGWSLMSVSYYALGSDLSQSYDENTRYASFREVFNILGVLLALLLPYVYSVADKPSESLLLMNDAIMIALPFVLIIFLFKIRVEKITKSVNSIKVAFASFIKELKSSKYLFGAFFLNSFANALPATLFLLYVELVIGSKEQAGLLLLLYFFSGVVALLFWNYLASKTSKKTAWTFSMLNAILFFSFVPFLGEGDFNYFLIITIFSGMSLGADMALPTSMQADVAQKPSDTVKEQGGTLFGFFAMLTKLSLAFGVGVSFVLLGLFDFSPTNPSESSLFVLTLLYGTLPVILKLIAITLLHNYKEN